MSTFDSHREPRREYPHLASVAHEVRSGTFPSSPDAFSCPCCSCCPASARSAPMQGPRRTCRRPVCPGVLLPVVIATEVLGAIAIILGWQTRIAALLLAGYSLLAALVFHTNFADQIEMIMFLKNVSIAGGFLLLVGNGAGPLSLDRRRAR